jgi:hypothetical protein
VSSRTGVGRGRRRTVSQREEGGGVLRAWVAPYQQVAGGGGGSGGGAAQQQDDVRRRRERAGGEEAARYGPGETILGAGARGSGALPACLVGGWRWLAHPHQLRCHRQGAGCGRPPAPPQSLMQRLLGGSSSRTLLWLGFPAERCPRGWSSRMLLSQHASDHSGAQRDEAVQKSTSRDSGTGCLAEPIFKEFKDL